MSLSFHTFNRDTRQFYPAAGAVESYPGGDIAVRHLQPAPAGSVPVAWNAGGTLDYAALAQWVAPSQPMQLSPVQAMPSSQSALLLQGVGTGSSVHAQSALSVHVQLFQPSFVAMVLPGVQCSHRAW